MTACVAVTGPQFLTPFLRSRTNYNDCSTESGRCGTPNEPFDKQMAQGHPWADK